MSLFNKIKDILFEEEEQTEAIKTIKEEPIRKEPIERKIESPIQSNNDFNGNNFTKEEVNNYTIPFKLISMIFSFDDKNIYSSTSIYR